MPYPHWSNNPNAPQIPRSVYIAEKADFVGSYIGTIAYGLVTVLFFRCMSALLSPVVRAGGNIKWLLVVHSAVMFSLVTVFTGMYLNLQSISFIDNREFPGNTALPPGPLGYQHLVYSQAVSLVSRVMFMLNNWLVDGLLLYRCCIIYGMNYWAVAFPGVMYLASFAMGVVLIYFQASRPDCTTWRPSTADVGTAYFSISLSLNVILTLMIVGRLLRHSRLIRDAMGPLVRPSGLYNALVSILVESCALYAITFILFIGAWSTSNPAQFIFFPILANIQVIAPLLVILRVANKKSLTEDIVSREVGSIRFKGSSTSGDSTLGATNLDHEKA